MAKGKYEKWLTEESLLLLEGWARDGLTDEDISRKMGIRRSTLFEWKKRFSDISNALKKGKEVADYEVVSALYKKALGYTVKVKKNFKLKRVEYENGKRILEQEELVSALDEIHIPADTTAQIYWLKNRRPDKWRDKPQPEGETEMLKKARELLEEVDGAF